MPRRAGPLLVLSGAVLLAYGGVLGLTLHSEDFELIAGGASWGFGGNGFFRPAVIWTLHLLHALAGWRPAAFHGFLLLVHLACCDLLYLLLERWLRSPWAALLGALLFAVHPIGSEAVIWVSALTSSLATFWILAAVLAWDHMLPEETGRPWSRRWLAVVLLCQALALMSKETGVVLPLLLVAVTVARGVELRRALPPLMVSGALEAGYLAFYLACRLPPAEGFPVTLGYHTFRSLRHFLLSAVALRPVQDRALVALDGNLGLQVPPAGGSGAPPAAAGVALAAVLGLLFLAALVWRYRSRWSLLGLVWILAGGTFLWLRPFHVLDWSYPFPSRFYYLPLVGFAIVVAAVAERLLASWGGTARPVLAAVMALVLLAGVTGIHRRMDDWRVASRLVERSLAAFRAVVAAGLPAGVDRIVLVNPQDSYREAFVFRNGLPGAIRACCPQPVPVTVVREPGPPRSLPGPDHSMILWWHPATGTWIRVR